MDLTNISSAQKGPARNIADNGGGRNALLDSDFETFLRMLTTQMQNQDPMNPMEASDFAVQLATFSSVEQQIRTNRLLEELTLRSGLGELASWVGMEARADAAARFDGDPLTIGVDPLQGAEHRELVVRNAFRNEVARMPLEPGQSSVQWSGTDATGTRLPSGYYSFEQIGYIGGEPVESTPADVYARVIEARLDAGTTVLVLEGGVEVEAASVTALRAPG